MSAAFVPVFTDVAEAKGWDKARAVLANAAGLLAVILAALLVLLELGLLAWLTFAPGGWDRMLLLQLVVIVLPFMFTICLLALGSAALNCRGHFAYPAFAPILLNIFLIAGAWCAHSLFTPGTWPGLFVLSASVVVAGVVQLVGVVWLLRSVQLAAMPNLRPVLPAVRRMARFALPMMIPLGITQLSAIFDSFYAWIMTATPDAPTFTVFNWTIAKPLSEGVVTCLYAAGRLYQFPLGILAISLATAVFPLFSRYAARGDIEGLRDATNRSLRLSLFLGVPAGVGLILLARPIVDLIYRHGRFSPQDAARAASILQMYSLGMWAYFCNHILLRAFFSQKDTSTPLKITCVLAAVNVVLVAVGIFTPLRAGAIGLATAFTSSVTAVLLAWILRRRWGRIEAGKILASLVKTAVAACGMAGVIGLVLWYLPPLLIQMGRLASSGIVVGVSVTAGSAVFLLTARMLRMPELGEFLGSLRKNKPADDS